jgi:hypothetical protein
MRLRGRGIHRIPRADQMAAAAKPICAAPVAMGCFIALQLSDLKWLQSDIMDAYCSGNAACKPHARRRLQPLNQTGVD